MAMRIDPGKFDINADFIGKLKKTDHNGLVVAICRALSDFKSFKEADQKILAFYYKLLNSITPNYEVIISNLNYDIIKDLVASASIADLLGDLEKLSKDFKKKKVNLMPEPTDLMQNILNDLEAGKNLPEIVAAGKASGMKPEKLFSAPLVKIPLDDVLRPLYQSVFNGLRPEVIDQYKMMPYVDEEIEKTYLTNAIPKKPEAADPVAPAFDESRETASNKDAVDKALALYKSNVDTEEAKRGRYYLDDIKVAVEFMDPAQIVEIYEAIRYKGFDRRIKIAVASISFDATGMAVIATLGALRGSNHLKYKEIRVPMRDKTSKTVIELFDSNIFSRDSKGKPRAINPTNLAAAIPWAVAYMLFQVKDHIPARVTGISIPTWLQFPAAAGIKIKDEFKADMKTFQEKFSVIINQKKTAEEIKAKNLGFNEQLFNTIVANAERIPEGKIRDTLSAAWSGFA